MTKTELTSAIGTAIAIIVSRVKVLLGLSKIVDVLYPTEVNDTEVLQTYTTKGGTSITYSLYFIKQGNVVYFRLSFRNVTTTSLSGGDSIFTFKNTEYKPKAVSLFYFKTTSGTSVINLYLSPSGIVITSTLPPDTNFSTDFITYIAQD